MNFKYKGVMNLISLKYGKSVEEIELPHNVEPLILKGHFKDAAVDHKYELGEIERSLENPIGSKRLQDIVSPGQKVVIMASDITRPSPTKKLVPPLLYELGRAGVTDGDITIVFGMGIHRPHTENEKMMLVGEDAYGRIRCIDSCTDEFINIGTTSRGTPVNVCSTVLNADVRICTGNIEYHYFAGYSGGAKAIMPGACNFESISANHKLQLKDGVKSGAIDGNPVREDIDEAGGMVGISFILNVVLNDEKKILKAFSGDYIKAHREGCRYLDTLYSCSIPDLADIVVVSAGGYPKDINLYQAQKALDNASHAVRMGGIIILAAECREGFGEPTFEKWIHDASCPDDLIERLRNTFVLGGHKAAAIARVLKKAKVYFISGMDKEKCESIYFMKKDNLQQAVDDAVHATGESCSMIVIPQGGSILPKL
jgi:Uncharacterized conserved protein